MMNAWLTLDFVATRYGKLPSEVLKSGDTADVQCAELAVQYENFKRNEEKDGKTAHNHSQEDLLNMVKEVKEKKNETASEN